MALNMKRTWIVTAIASIVVLLAVGANLLGLAGLERHHGYLAPVWDRAGKRIYYLERRTYGIVWGLGWELFSPPASAYALSDVFSLHRLDPASGESEQLQSWPLSPIVQRVIKQYHGSIFAYPSAHLRPDAENGIELLVRLSAPEQPRSQTYNLKGVWHGNRPAAAAWRSGSDHPSASEFVLVNGREVVTIDGREAYPAAIAIIEPDGRHRIVLRGDKFATLYRGGVPDQIVAKKSRRKAIEKARELRRVRAQLEEKYRRQGMNETAATLRTGEEMEDLGYTPKGPRTIATHIDAAPAGLPVFVISAEEFRVGLFLDIAAALAQPGREVRSGSSTYIRYHNFDTSKRINAWRKAGNRRMVVRHLDRLYLIEYRRFER